MKIILLLMPDAHMHTIKIGSYIKSLREAPLTLTVLAALLNDFDVEISIVDESIDRVPKNCSAGLVGISVLTGTAIRAYSWAKYFKRLGKTVILGGPHVTVLPNEAAKHADSIVIGMAERTWPKLFQDWQHGKLQKRYEDFDLEKSRILEGVPSPRTDLQRCSGYMIPYTVQATRGCKHRCDFCAVTPIWRGYHKRPVADVIRDIRQIPTKLFTFNDVSLVDDVEYAKELFKAIIPLKKKWGALATVLVADDIELLDLMAKSGCRYLLIGFESFNQENLDGIKKGFNLEKNYARIVDLLHERNISIQGTFVFGFDNDDTDVFKNTVEKIQELKIDIPRYSIYTPYPGTVLFDRLSAEGRLLSTNWEDYDTMHVVIEPLKMSASKLFDGFKWAYKETFKMKNIMSRLKFKLNFNYVINMVGNLTYKKFVHRLYNDERFKKPYGFGDNKLL